MEFIDNLSIDDKLFWKVGATEIYWTRASRPSSWGIKIDGDKLLYNRAAFEEILRANRVDLRDFERQLGVSVLTQAVFGDMVIKGAIVLFGKDVVERSVEDTRAFLNSVSAMAGTEIKRSAPPKSKLALVKT